jgi:hypothetical protein
LKSNVLKIAGIFGLVSFAHTNDAVLAFSVGTALNIGLSASDLLSGPRMSTALMRKCITQETETFSRSELERIDPEYPRILDRAVQAELLRLTDPENDWHVRDARNAIDHDRVADVLQEADETTAASVHSLLSRNAEQIAMALDSATVNASQARAALEGRDSKVAVNTIKSEHFAGRFGIEEPFETGTIDYAAREMDADAMILDFSRAMGSFTVQCVEGVCTAKDYFDFDVLL